MIGNDDNMDLMSDNLIIITYSLVTKNSEAK